MKVRITLIAKKEWGSMLPGEKMVMFNDVFDFNTGIAFFNIDRDQWKVERRDWYSGFDDVHGNSIYDGDEITADDSDHCTTTYAGTVIFDEGCFCLKIAEIVKEEVSVWSVGQTPPLFCFSNMIVNKQK